MNNIVNTLLKNRHFKEFIIDDQLFPYAIYRHSHHKCKVETRCDVDYGIGRGLPNILNVEGWAIDTYIYVVTQDGAKL